MSLNQQTPYMLGFKTCMYFAFTIAFFILGLWIFIQTQQPQAQYWGNGMRFIKGAGLVIAVPGFIVCAVVTLFMYDRYQKALNQSSKQPEPTYAPQPQVVYVMPPQVQQQAAAPAVYYQLPSDQIPYSQAQALPYTQPVQRVQAYRVDEPVKQPLQSRKNELANRIKSLNNGRWIGQ